MAGSELHGSTSNGDGDDSNANKLNRYRRAVVPYLTRIAHGSAPFLTTFLVIHLTAPALANLGGSSLASQVMLLGREYYQTSFGEKYLLLAPLAIHSISSFAKRVASPTKVRPWTSVLSITGYSALLVFIPMHFLTHRLNPADPSPPVFAVGPSELDYEFVKVGIQTWPWRSWFLYGGLVGCATLHLMEGMNVFWNTWFRSVLGRLKALSVTPRRMIASAIALPVLSGLFFMLREPLMTFSSVAARYKGAFEMSLFYRL